LVEPVLLEQLSVFLVGLVDLVELVVLKAWVVLQLLRDVSAPPEPASSNLEIRLLTVDSVDGKGILSEVRVSSLQESVHCVVGLDQKLAFVGVLLIKNFPKRLMKQEYHADQPSVSKFYQNHSNSAFCPAESLAALNLRFQSSMLKVDGGNESRGLASFLGASSSASSSLAGCSALVSLLFLASSGFAGYCYLACFPPLGASWGASFP
jgi:hypothetical protein